jgi:hypothetical protein
LRGFHATSGRFDDERSAEVFLTNHKPTAGILASDSVALCSIALRCGAPLDVICRALMRDARCAASGPLGVVLIDWPRKLPLEEANGLDQPT